MTAGTGVFVLRDPQTLVAMQTASFASENDSQRLLASFPELLAGDQIDAVSPRRFDLVAREQSIADEEGGKCRHAAGRDPDRRLDHRESRPGPVQHDRQLRSDGRASARRRRGNERFAALQRNPRQHPAPGCRHQAQDDTAQGAGCRGFRSGAMDWLKAQAAKAEPIGSPPTIVS